MKKSPGTAEYGGCFRLFFFVGNLFAGNCNIVLGNSAREFQPPPWAESKVFSLQLHHLGWGISAYPRLRRVEAVEGRARRPAKHQARITSTPMGSVIFLIMPVINQPSDSPAVNL